MIKTIAYPLIASSLLFGSLSCKKEIVRPTNSPLEEVNSFESEGEEKNNGYMYFTRCPNVKKLNLGHDITIVGKNNVGVEAVQIFVTDWTSGPAPIEDGYLLDEPTYSEDGQMKIFSTPDDFFFFAPGTSALGHTYVFLFEALDATGGIIESIECSVTVTEPFQHGIKGKKVKVVENNDGTAELSAIVNPRSYIDQDWVSTDQLTLSYDQLPPNALLKAGISYTLEYAGMKDNGNLLFTKQLSGINEYTPSSVATIDAKRTITEELIEPSSIYIFRPTTQQTIACSSNGMKLIDKTFNSFINSVTAVQKNNGNIVLKVKRSQKALIETGKDIYYAKITLSNINEPSLQESFIRYEWDYDGDGINNYPQTNVDDLLAGLWDFNGDELNDYESKLNYKVDNVGGGVATFNPSIGGANDFFGTSIEFFDRGNNSLGAASYLVEIE